MRRRGHSMMRDWRAMYLDYLEGDRPTPPSLDLIPSENRGKAKIWVASMEAARGVDPRAERPSTEELSKMTDPTKITNYDDQTWEAFQKSGMLWMINSLLVPFGWAIVLEYDNTDIELGKVVKAYPARVVQDTPAEDVEGRRGLVGDLTRPVG